MHVLLTLAMLATGAKVADISKPPDLREKRVTSLEIYCLEAYDCSEPEDAIIANIPPECAAKEERSSLPELSRTTRQDYTILQEVATFVYPATLCVVH